MFCGLDFENVKKDLFKAEEKLIDGEEIKEMEEYLINRICAINSRFSKHGAIEDFFNVLQELVNYMEDNKK